MIPTQYYINKKNVQLKLKAVTKASDRPTYIGFAKKTIPLPLVSKVDKTMNKLKANGTYDKLVKKNLK
jgi:ABC-type amino acid transport substrate-binding protein